MRCRSTFPKVWSPPSPLTRPDSRDTLCRRGDRGLWSHNFHARKRVWAGSFGWAIRDF